MAEEVRDEAMPSSPPYQAIVVDSQEGGEGEGEGQGEGEGNAVAMQADSPVHIPTTTTATIAIDLEAPDNSVGGPPLLDAAEDPPPKEAKKEEEGEEEEEEEDDSYLEGESISCPICMEPWTAGGPHRICCLACGHLFGQSCIQRWLKESGKKHGKCPHCNRRAKLYDIRPLYVPRLTVVDQSRTEELAKVRDENKDLIVQNQRLREEVHHMQALVAKMKSESLQKLKNPQPSILDFWQNCNDKRQHQGFELGALRIDNRLLNAMGGPSNSQQVGRERSSQDFCKTDMRFKREQSDGISRSSQHYNMPSNHGRQTACFSSQSDPHSFLSLLTEWPIQGAKVFDMDALNQIVLVALKNSDLGNSFCINKRSLLDLSHGELIHLPPGTGAVRDIHVAPSCTASSGRLALVASLGKKMSLLSMESNNIVLAYELQSPPWSCAWDPHHPNAFYAGLQNGCLLVFDLRQTSTPLKSIQGFNSLPIHCVYPISTSKSVPGVNAATANEGGILTASSGGVCFWDLKLLEDQSLRPCSISNPSDQGICVSLSYSDAISTAMATFRQKPEACYPLSQTQPTQNGAQPGPHNALHVPLRFAAGAGDSNHDLESAVGGPHADVKWAWQHKKAINACISPVGLSRSAFVHTQGGPTFFASGDESTRALWLWESGSYTCAYRLQPHLSSILDVRSVTFANQTLLGCISDRMLQVYRC